MFSRRCAASRACGVGVVALLGVALVAAAQAAVPTARISVDSASGSTRVVVTFSKAVSTQLVPAASGRLEIVCSEPVEVAPAESKIDDPLLKGWKVRDGRVIVLETGTGYRKYESFELRNPVRLVLDLQGERSAKAPSAPSRREQAPRDVVVIDPGHGGIEMGAVGPSGLQEKDVTLDLGRRLKTRLEREAAVSVVLTRDEDRLVGLDERAAIANHNRAALFVSIHLNAAKRRGAVGAETYFLSPDATDDESRTLAALENRASGVEEAPTADDGKADRGLDLILWDLAQNQYLAESSRLAEAVQREMNALAGTKDRGVRQAPFRVLQGATMPAILVEVGFVTSPDEEAKLKDDAYLDRIVGALSRAVQDYLSSRARLAAPGDEPSRRRP